MAPRRPVQPARPARRPATPAAGSTPRRPAGASAARPPTRSTAARTGDARPPRAPRPRPAGRAAPLAAAGRRLPVMRPVTMMSGVLVILALLIAPYVRPWLAQRSQLQQGRVEVARLQDQVAALKAERDRWDDPAYVRAQARSRLRMVMPGEVAYVRLDPKRGAAPAQDPRSAAAAVPPRHPQAWYGTLWQSVVGAGSPGGAGTP
jgi:cell division protein FtsB